MKKTNLILLSVIIGLPIIFMGIKTYKLSQKSDLYRMVYRVHYNNENVRIDTIINEGPIYVGSDRGTNFIKRNDITGSTVIKSSAPIEVISYSKLPTEVNKPLGVDQTPYIIMVIDSCEYICNETYGIGNYVYTHKGNCRFCAERRRKEINEYVQQLNKED